MTFGWTTPHRRSASWRQRCATVTAAFVCVSAWLAPTAAVADDDALAWASSICSKVNQGGQMGLVAANLAVTAYERTLQADADQVKIWTKELDALRTNRNQLAAEVAQMGNSPAIGITLIQRAANARKKNWRDQFQPALAALRADAEPVSQQVAALRAELAQAELALKAEEDKAWLSRRSAVVKKLTEAVNDVKTRMAAPLQLLGEKAKALAEKQAEVDGLVAAEDTAAQQKINEHVAQFTQKQNNHTEAANKVSTLEGKLTPLQASLGKRQTAVGQAHRCIRTATPKADSTSTAGYDPTKDPTGRTPTDRGNTSGGTDAPSPPSTPTRDPKSLGGGAAPQDPGYTKPAGGTRPAGTGTGTDSTALPPSMLPGAATGGVIYPPGTLPGPIGAPLPPRQPRTPRGGDGGTGTTGGTGGGTGSGVTVAQGTTPAVPAATGAQCNPPLCREKCQVNCRSFMNSAGGCGCDGLSSCGGGTSFSVAQVKAECYQNMLTRCNQGMAGGTGGWCVKQGSDASCAARAQRVCGCPAATHPQCTGKWDG